MSCMQNAITVHRKLSEAYDSFNGCTVRSGFCKNEAEYRQYINEITQNGYTVYAESNIDNNLSATLVYNGTIVQASYIPCEQSFLLAEDTKSVLYPSFPEPGEAVCKPMLWQFEVDHSLIDCGMCYIIRLSDGSFFVIDSAHFYSVHDDERLHDFLLAHTPAGKKTVIAAWFLSHGHDDHIAKFMDFVKYQTQDVTIERIYYNFPEVTHRDNGYWSESDKQFVTQYRELLDKHNEISVIHPHTGQVFFVRDMKCSVLCTHEDVRNGTFSNYNDTSTVLLCEIAGTKIFFPGDAGGLCNEVLLARYSHALSCDIMQQSHHGHFGLSVDFYKKANAKTVLFPVTRIKFDEEWEHYEANRVAFALAEENFIASEGTVALPLPYQPGTAVLYPDETNENFDGIFNLWCYEYTDERKKELTDAFGERRQRPMPTL